MQNRCCQGIIELVPVLSSKFDQCKAKLKWTCLIFINSLFFVFHDTISSISYPCWETAMQHLLAPSCFPAFQVQSLHNYSDLDWIGTLYFDRSMLSRFKFLGLAQWHSRLVLCPVALESHMVAGSCPRKWTSEWKGLIFLSFSLQNAFQMKIHLQNQFFFVSNYFHGTMWLIN